MAGGQDRHPRAKAHQRLHQVRRRVDDMLKIIEYQQQLLATDAMGDRLRCDIDATGPQPKHLGHRGRHEVGIGQRRQLDHPPAVAEFPKDTACDLQREAVFPMPPGPVRVTTRQAEMRFCNCCLAAIRPTSRVTINGRLVPVVSPVSGTR